jgi:hypothetical protein
MNAIFYLVGFSCVIDVGWFLWMKHVCGVKDYATEEEDHNFGTNLWW